MYQKKTSQQLGCAHMITAYEKTKKQLKDHLTLFTVKFLGGFIKFWIGYIDH